MAGGYFGTRTKVTPSPLISPSALTFWSRITPPPGLDSSTSMASLSLPKNSELTNRRRLALESPPPWLPVGAAGGHIDQRAVAARARDGQVAEHEVGAAIRVKGIAESGRSIEGGTEAIDAEGL